MGKRVIYLFLALAMVFLLCACGPKADINKKIQEGTQRLSSVENCHLILQITVNPQLYIYLDEEGNVLKADAGNEDAANAVKAYSYIIKKYIGAYAAAMGGVDAIVFGGGIGRNSASVRQMSLEGLEFLGAELDEDKNNACKGGDDLSADGSRVRIFVVDTNEEIIVARKAKALLEEK